jgi:hypothetical protein
MIAIGAEWITGKTVSNSPGIPLRLPEHSAMFELSYGTGYWLHIMAALNYY